MTINTIVQKITSIPRGADLTDADLVQLVTDFYEVRNWAALVMRLGPEGVKARCLVALRVRLGRDAQVGEVAE